MAGVFDDATAATPNAFRGFRSAAPLTPGEQQRVDEINAGQSSEFTKGLRRAVRNAAATSRGFVGGVAEPFAPEFAEGQFAEAEKIIRSQPAADTAAVESFRDVDDLGSAFQYGTGALGEGLASVGTIVAAGLAGRLGATVARAGPTARNLSQYGASTAAMIPQEGGETALSLRQNPEAMANTTALERAGLTLGKGVVGGALESIVPNVLFTNAISGAAGRIAAGARPALSNIGRKAAAGVVGEAGTEGAQEFSGQVAENIAAPGTGYDSERVMEAAVRGAITGGVLGGAGGGIQALRSNIDAAADAAREATGTQEGVLNAAVERLDNLIRNPEQAGEDLTNATLGSLAEAVTRAGEIGGELGDAAGPAAASGMDAVAAIRQRFDRAVAGQLTPENRQKYLDLTENFRLLQPTEYERLRDALETGDSTTINEAIGDVAFQLRERVPRETFEGLKNITNWAKKFGSGVTRAAREGRKASQSYAKEDIVRFRAFLNDQYPQVLRAMDSTDASDQLARTLMAYRDNAQLLNTSLRPNDQAAIEYFEAEAGAPLLDVLDNARRWRNDNLTVREREQAFSESTGDSQISRVTSDMERLLTPELQESFAAAGIEIGPGATEADTGGIQREAPTGRLGEELQRVFDENNNQMDVEQPVNTPFRSFKLLRQTTAATNQRANPAYSIPATLTSADGSLTPEQIGILVGSKTSTNQGTRQQANWVTEIGELTDEQIAQRVKDGGFQTTFNTVDIAAQAGTPQERGGAKELFEAAVPQFEGNSRDLGIQGYRLMSAIATLHTNGIEIERSDIPPAVLQRMGLEPEGDPIRIKVDMPANALGEDTVVQRKDGRSMTLGDLTGANRFARSLSRQLALLESLIQTLPQPREGVNGQLQRLRKQAGAVGKTADALSRGLYSFTLKQESELPRMKAVEKRDTINSYAEAYAEDLRERVGDTERAAQERRNIERLRNGLRGEEFTPGDVRDALFVLRRAYSPDERQEYAEEQEAREAATTSEELEALEEYSDVDPDKLATEDDVLLWADELELEYATTNDLVEVLERFESEDVEQYEIQQALFNQEPTSQEPTATEVFEASRRSPEGAETNLRKRGIDKQNDAQERAEYEAAQRRYEGLSTAPPEQTQPTPAQTGKPKREDYATQREFFLALKAWNDANKAQPQAKQKRSAARAKREAATTVVRQPGESMADARARAMASTTGTPPPARPAAQPQGETANARMIRERRERQQQATPGLTTEQRETLAAQIGAVANVEELDVLQAGITPTANPKLTVEDATFLQEQIEARRAELTATALGAFEQRIVDGTEFAGDRSILATTVRNWAAKYLNGREVRVVEFDPNDADVKDYFARTSRNGEIPLGRALQANRFAPDTPAVILLQQYKGRKGGRKYARLHTLAHEFGHTIEQHAFQDAPQELKDGVDAAYARLVQNLAENGEVDEAMFNAGTVLRFIRDKEKAAVLEGSATYDENTGLIADGVVDRIARGDQAYILNKSEFFAEQFAKYAMNQPNIFAGESKTVRDHLAGVLASVRKFYREVIRRLDRTAPEFDTFMKWLGTPAAERPPLSNFDPAAFDERNPPPPEGTTAAAPPPQQERRSADNEVQRRIYEARLEDMTPQEKDEAIAELRQKVDVDERTGLGTNAKWLRTDKKRHIVSLDVDNLKAVNDNMGHEAGDQLLALVGEALTAVGLKGDSFHISGDEFYVHHNNKNTLAQKLREAQAWLADKVVTGGDKEFTGPSFSFGMGTSLETAEAALQADKKAREEAGERTPRGEIPPSMRDVPRGTSPPQGPPEGPGTPAPPPPPDRGAQERFVATVKRLLGNRVNVEFNVDDLPDGVAAEYESRFGQTLEDTGKALKEVRERRRSEITALQERRGATQEDIEAGKVDPRTPAQIQTSIDALNALEQEYLNDLAVRGTIRVAAGMEAQAGLAEHEALHAAFEIFFGQDNAADRKVLTTAFTQGVLARSLQNYFAGNEEVLNVIDPARVDTFRAEEAAAYGFQVFIHEPGALQLGAKVEGIFNRMLAFLQKLIGYQTYEERARTIMNDLNSGRRSERGTSVLRDRAGMERSMLSRSQDFVRGVGTGFMHMYDTVLSSSYSRLADSGNVAMAQIARLGYNETGERGEGMIQRQRHMTTQWSNRLKEALHALTEEELGELNRAMLLNEELPPGRLGEAQKRLRRILADVHQYQVDAGIELGHRQDYYPMIWNPEKVAADYQGFIDMLNKYPEELAEMKATADEVFERVAAYEERGHEFQGVFGKDGEPVADSSRRRSLGFITAEDRLKYMDDSLITTMAHYLNQSVRHAEYVRAYGQNGSRLRELIGEVRSVYGGSQDDVNLVKDYIDGLMGNKEVGMSRELKDLYGAATVYQNVRLLPLSVFSSLVDPLGVAVRTQSMGAAFDTFTYSVRNLFTDFRNESNWSPDQWAQFAADMGTIDMSGTVKSIDKIYTGVTLRGKTRAINDAFFKYNLLNGWVKNNHIMATKAAQLYLRRSAEGMFGEQMSADNLSEVGLTAEDVVYDEGLGRIRATAPEILGYENAEQMEQQATEDDITAARAKADKIQQAIHKIVRQSLIQPSSAEMPGWMSNPYLAPIAHLKTFVFGFNATILERLRYEAERGNYSPIYYAAAYVPGMIAADFIKGFAGNGGEEPEWKKNWTLADYTLYGVQRSGLTGTGQFFAEMNNDVTRGGGGWESLAGPTLEQATDLMRAMNAKTSQPTATWMLDAMPVNALYDQWINP